MNPSTLVVAGLVTVACGGLLYAFVYPLLSGEARAEKRQAAIKQPTARRVPGGARIVDTTQRRKQVADSLKEIESRATRKLTLDAKIAQAGLTLSRQQFFLGSGVLAVAAAGLIYLMSGSPLIALPGLFIGGFGVPMWALGFLRKRRIAKFVDKFPDAVDVIVRGIRSGLPVADCLRVIAQEAAEPVRSEFRQIVETQAVGLSAAEAVERLVDRVPVTETNFFSIVITIQQKSGGSLAESLGNLSRVLRERKKMKGKIGAMSMEAKASAAIIGALPFIVALLVYFSSPKYMTLLWTTTAGKVAVAISGFWMLIGCIAMKRMISFDI
jgi:tight adherence protein B